MNAEEIAKKWLRKDTTMRFHYLERVGSALLTAIEALEFSRDELGMPQPGYPAPVANAANKIREALAKIREGNDNG